jgi:8-oxo-dGTP pyrophosphatase MutT (NUDIX family)
MKIMDRIFSMIDNSLPKVTAFLTRNDREGTELLLFRHPNAGIQIPAGTVEEGESFEQAVLREVAEETGLANVRVVKMIGQIDELPSEASHVILQTTKVYSRPDLTSFDWATLRRGIEVQLKRQENGFAQVTYTENDRYPNPAYISYQITGWIPEEILAGSKRRYLYHLMLEGEAPDTWEQPSDNHRFQLFWAPLSNLPDIIPPQRKWWELAVNEFNYRF